MGIITYAKIVCNVFRGNHSGEINDVYTAYFGDSFFAFDNGMLFIQKSGKRLLIHAAAFQLIKIVLFFMFGAGFDAVPNKLFLVLFESLISSMRKLQTDKYSVF